MNKDMTKNALKVAGAFAAATGVVALSALVASGAAVGAIAEGFKSAGRVVKKSLEKAEQNETPETVVVEEDPETVKVPAEETVEPDVTEEEMPVQKV